MGFAFPFPCSTPGCPGRSEYRGKCRTCARVRERARELEPGRRLYFTARWRRLRALVLDEQPTCAECARHDVVTASAEVHHTRPHHGDPAIFFDRRVLEALCKPCHSRETAGDVWGRGDR